MESKLLTRILNRAPALIAEIGVNYYDIARKLGVQPIYAAEQMVRVAAASGASAVKFQSYKADSLAAADSPAYWDLSENPIKSQRELFAKYDMFGEDEFALLAWVAADVGVEFMSTPFDFQSADYIDRLVNIHKISSSDLTNLPFIRYIASKGKPCIMSTGAGSLDEIRRAVSVIRSVNEEPLVLMHCVLEYPTPRHHANLGKIIALQQEFPQCYIGYSDHTKPTDDNEILKLATALGAHIIEKHFTLDKTLRGNDHFHSMDPEDTRRIVHDMESVCTIIGSHELKWEPSESSARMYARRSAVAVRDLPAGTVLTPSDIIYKRPGTGIPPDDTAIFGAVLTRSVTQDTIIKPEDLQH